MIGPSLKVVHWCSTIQSVPVASLKARLFQWKTSTTVANTKLEDIILSWVSECNCNCHFLQMVLHVLALKVLKGVFSINFFWLFFFLTETSDFVFIKIRHFLACSWLVWKLFCLWLIADVFHVSFSFQIFTMATISIGCSVPGCNFNTPEVAKHFYPNMVDQLKVPPSKWSIVLLMTSWNLDPQLHQWSCHNDGNMGKIIWSRQAVASSSLGLNINMQVTRLVVNYQFEARGSMFWWWGV